MANAILHAAANGDRDIYVGGAGRLMSAMGHQAPRTMDWVSERVMIDRQKRDEPPRNPEGALHRAGADGNVRGDHPGYVRKISFYTRVAMHPLMTAGALAASVAAVAWLGGAFGG